MSNFARSVGREPERCRSCKGGSECTAAGPKGNQFHKFASDVDGCEKMRVKTINSFHIFINLLHDETMAHRLVVNPQSRGGGVGTHSYELELQELPGEQKTHSSYRLTSHLFAQLSSVALPIDISTPQLHLRLACSKLYFPRERFLLRTIQSRIVH